MIETAERRKRRFLRAVAAAGVVAAASFFGPSAAAHHTIDFDTHNCAPEPSPTAVPEAPVPTAPEEVPEPEPTPDGCMPLEGERIVGTRDIAFSVRSSPPHALKRVSLYILSQEEGIPSAADGADLLDGTTFSNSTGSRVYSYEEPFSWDSRTLTPRNGRYLVKVEAETHRSTLTPGHVDFKERQGLLVDNPPVTPGTPRIVSATVSSVTIDWLANTEPDILSYTVYRAVSTQKTDQPAGFKPIGVTTAPTFRDSDVGAGYHYYAVTSTRRSVVTPEAGISSAPSGVSVAAEVKTVEDRQSDEDDDGKAEKRPIFRRQLSAPRVLSRSGSVPDAPFKYKLPYDDADGVPSTSAIGGTPEERTDPRGPVLPVAVGMFLVSSALAVGRMPY